MKLIDADLIMDYLIDEGQNNGEKYGIHWGDKIKFTPYEVAEIVARTVPTVDAVPVVRCKDCEFLQLEDMGMYATCGKGCLGMVRPNDYCSRGERKENDNG